jgi:hypothetical protein
MDSGIETLWCSECSLLPSGTHEKTSDGWVGATPSFLFYDGTSFGFFLSAQAKNVLTLQVTSFKPNCWPSSLPESETPRISPLVSVPSSKAMSDRCIHVVLSLFLESRRSGLPRIQITESTPEQDLISALCPQPHNQVPHKVHFFLNFCKVGNHMKFRDFGRRKAPWESVS